MIQELGGETPSKLAETFSMAFQTRQISSRIASGCLLEQYHMHVTTSSLKYLTHHKFLLKRRQVCICYSFNWHGRVRA